MLPFLSFLPTFLFQPSSPPAKDPWGAVVRDWLPRLPPDRWVVWQLPGGTPCIPGYVLRPLWVRKQTKKEHGPHLWNCALYPHPKVVYGWNTDSTYAQNIVIHNEVFTHTDCMIPVKANSDRKAWTRNFTHLDTEVPVVRAKSCLVDAVCQHSVAMCWTQYMTGLDI